VGHGVELAVVPTAPVVTEVRMCMHMIVCVSTCRLSLAGRPAELHGVPKIFRVKKAQSSTVWRITVPAELARELDGVDLVASLDERGRLYYTPATPDELAAAKGSRPRRSRR
jgi:hypothetical protein